jgi:hypothetical protein
MSENFKEILEFADQVFEKFPDRRDSLKIQAGVEWMRRIAEEVGDRWKTTEGGRFRFRRGRKDRADFSGSLIQLCL